ncbi:pitrilysin family protein [Clostridium oceanicum]|uniref:Pitrilysin family protein n=1 Tax=Clostridium oceanicum TaxID=1543 RepID=A0ABN1JUW3_9CLOT
MELDILNNGIKVLYEKSTSNVTSICIGFNGGAIEEENKKFPFGTAHALEHMISKGTINRNEKEINELSDSIFGFENAMTNYPYVVYYGTVLNEDFIKALDFYSDILINPSFPEKGFKEEMDVISEELREWKEDLYQYSEDKLLKNSFYKRRIKERIIGNENSIKNISLETIKEFYNKYYTPENCTISIVSSLHKGTVIELIKEYFEGFVKDYTEINKEEYESITSGIYKNYKKGMEGCKISIFYPIHDLDEIEIDALRIFNNEFGVGTSSILFDEIRTKNGLAYDVGSIIKNERGIKLYKIYLGTSKEKAERCIDIIKESIEKAKKIENNFTEEKIRKIYKSIKLRKEIRHESSIRLALDMTTYELMYKGDKNLDRYLSNIEKIDDKLIHKVINKVFKEGSIEMLL